MKGLSAMLAFEARMKTEIASSRFDVVHGEFVDGKLRLSISQIHPVDEELFTVVVDFDGIEATVIDRDGASAVLASHIELEVERDPKIHASFREHMDRAVEMEDPRP